jgi:molybdopterin synthase catalytic subunit
LDKEKDMIGSHEDGSPPSLDGWLREIKAESGSDAVGIFLMHHGVVRATSKEDGLDVAGMELSYDRRILAGAIAEAERMPGVVGVRVWINEGRLAVGADMVYALVAGDARTNVLPAWTNLVKTMRERVYSKREIIA